MSISLLSLFLSCMAAPPQGDITKDLAPHPRLFAKAENWVELKNLQSSDESVRKECEAILRASDRHLKSPARKEGISDGPRSEWANQMAETAFAYRLTGEGRYADYAKQSLLNAVRLPKWIGPIPNDPKGGEPVQHLAANSIAVGVATVFDWLYDDLSDSERKEVVEGLSAHWLRPLAVQHAAAKRNPKHWLNTPAWNMAIIVDASAIVAALAIAEANPALTRTIMGDALPVLAANMVGIGPDGGWNEGPAYGSGTAYGAVRAIAALESATGKVPDALAKLPGLSKIASYRLHASGPSGNYFNFGDAGEGAPDEPQLLWLAKRYKQPGVVSFFDTQPSNRRANPYQAIWRAAYVEQASKEEAKAVDPPLAAYHRGVEVVTMRSSWRGKDSLFVAVKGAGDFPSGHSKPDAGTFVLESAGIRWVTNLSMPNTSEATFQNTLLVKGKGQRPATEARCRVVSFNPDEKKPCTVIDLTGAYPSPVRSARRGVAFLDGGCVLVSDEAELSAASKVEWAIHTTAEVKSEGSVARLTHSGKFLNATIVSPKGAKFVIEDQKVPGREGKEGSRILRRLVVRTDKPTTRVEFKVVFSPLDGSVPDLPALPLAKWPSRVKP